MLKTFIDLEKRCIRKAGEVFELTKKRFDEITLSDETLIEKVEVQDSDKQVGE